jgi:hypothetical protein
MQTHLLGRRSKEFIVVERQHQNRNDLDETKSRSVQSFEAPLEERHSHRGNPESTVKQDAFSGQSKSLSRAAISVRPSRSPTRLNGRENSQVRTKND